jgi:two-component system KDP operon response regulator KdpE
VVGPAHGPSRILLVEDDELNRVLVRTVLARATDPMLQTVCLVEADGLAQARARLAEAPVDVVLLDLRLLDGSGLTLLGELTGADGWRPRVIVVSGGAPSEQRSAALAAGCDAFLSKPYSPADLLSMLVAHLAPPDLPSEGPAA